MDTSRPDSTPSPTSPSHVPPANTAVSNGDVVINIQPGPGDGDVIELDSTANQSNVIRQAREPGAVLAHITPTSSHRSEDGRMKLVQRSEKLKTQFVIQF